MKKRLRQIAMILVAIYILWKLIGGLLPGPKAESAELLANRIWFSKMPTDARESVRTLFLLDRGRKIGATSLGSSLHFTIDVLGWKLNRDRLEIMFLQAEQKQDYSVRTWKCKGEAPEPFDMCLELGRNGQKIRLYSGVDWEQIRKRLPFTAEEEKALEEAPSSLDVDCPSCKEASGTAF